MPLSRRTVWLSVALGVVLLLPSVFVGFFCDDYLQLLALRDDAGARELSLEASRFDLYRFAIGDVERARRFILRGPWPWWMDPALRAAFWRPLASAALAADHAVFGMHAWGYHVHAVLWYGALIACVGALYRRVLLHAAAPLALVVFAIDEGHVQATAWLAARYSIMSATFGVLALLAHVRAREGGNNHAVWLALLALVTSLAFGESAVGTLGYVAAFELLGATDSVRARVRALAPYAALFVVYLALHRTLGYGVQHIGHYLDPFAETGAFLAAAPSRLAMLIGALVASLPIDLWLVVPEARVPLVAAGAVATVAFGLLLRATLRSLDPETRRSARWLALGAVLSLVPSLGAAQGSRLLVLPSVGASVAIALVVHGAYVSWRRPTDGKASPRASGVFKLGGAWLGLANVVLAVPMIFMQLSVLRWRAAVSLEPVRNLAVENGDRIAILRGEPIVSVYGAAPLYVERGVLPAAWNVVALTEHPMKLTRLSERELDVEILEGTLMEGSFEELYRRAPIPLGYEATTVSFTVRVTELAGGRPKRLLLKLANGITLLVHEGRRFVPLALPAIGETKQLPRGPGMLD